VELFLSSAVIVRCWHDNRRTLDTTVLVRSARTHQMRTYAQVMPIAAQPTHNGSTTLEALT